MFNGQKGAENILYILYIIFACKIHFRPFKWDYLRSLLMEHVNRKKMHLIL